MEFEQTVTIQRPLEEVFAYMSNAEHDAEWRTNVVEIKHVGEGQGSGVGTMYHQVVKGPFGRGLPADLRYTAFEPNQRIAFETITGPVRPKAEITFSAVSGTATQVRIHMTWEPTGAMKLAAPLIGGMLKRSLKASYANLVRHMEAK